MGHLRLMEEVSVSKLASTRLSPSGEILTRNHRMSFTVWICLCWIGCHLETAAVSPLSGAMLFFLNLRYFVIWLIVLASEQGWCTRSPSCTCSDGGLTGMCHC